jgi:type IV fimbrial biogenesis protein FimT
MPREKGFTSIELLVVVAIAGVLLSASIPGFRLISLSSARSTGAASLVMALNQARGEAIARNVAVSVCRRDFFTSATVPRCDSESGDWEEGWIVYTGSDPTTFQNLVGVYDPIGYVSAAGTDNSFRVKPSSSSLSTLEFLPNGRSPDTVSFTVCERSGMLAEGRRVELASSGRASSRVLTASETIVACAT